MVGAVLTTAAMLAPTGVIATATLMMPVEVAGQEQSRAVGDWTGVLPPPAGLTLVLHIAADSAGGLKGTLDSPDQGANGIPIDTVRFANDTLTVRINALGVDFTAALSADRSKLTGEFRQGGYTFPLEMTKGGAPEVAALATPASYLAARSSDPSFHLGDRIEEPIERFHDEQHILEVVDLERLIDDGIEVERAAVALRAERIRGVAV
jgi:hypothetical protein